MQTWDMRQEMRTRQGVGRLGVRVPGIGPYECADGWVYGFLGTPGGAPWSEMLAWMIEEGKAEDLEQEPQKSMAENIDMPFLTSIMLEPETAVEKLAKLQHVHEVLERFIASKSKWDVYQEGQNRRLLIGIVSTPEDLVRNPQLNFRRYYREVHHPELADTLRYPGPPYVLSETPAALHHRPPLIGEHNKEVYCGELGLSRQELEALHAAGAV